MMMNNNEQWQLRTNDNKWQQTRKPDDDRHIVCHHRHLLSLSISRHLSLSIIILIRCWCWMWFIVSTTCRPLSILHYPRIIVVWHPQSFLFVVHGRCCQCPLSTIDVVCHPWSLLIASLLMWPWSFIWWCPVSCVSTHVGWVNIQFPDKIKEDGDMIPASHCERREWVEDKLIYSPPPMWTVTMQCIVTT